MNRDAWLDLTFVILGLILAFLVGVAIAVGAFAQDPPGPKALPDGAQVKILKIQKHQMELAQQYQQCTTLQAQIPKDFNSDEEQINKIGQEAMKEMKLDPEKWQVDSKGLTVIPKPPTAKFEEKKPEPEKK